jgi:hypothetical protein
MATNDPFWMVWSERGHAPTYKHDSNRSATSEAERLARTNPGERFYVLRAMRYVERHDVIRVELNIGDEEIPF